MSDGQTPALRASDADRDDAVVALREHLAEGRLTLEEFAARAERALAARTLDELRSVASDLPTAVQRSRRPPARITIAVFSNTQRTGRWRLGRFSSAFVLFGDGDVDLRQAVLDGAGATITAFVLFGNVDFYVPEALEVDFGGVTVFGHRREWGRDASAHVDAPLVRIRVFSLFGTSDLWRVPAAWAGRPFRQVIKALRRGEERELPAG
jgi:hypothetical protein